jgi:MbtH protein
MNNLLPDEDPFDEYTVVINVEEQYSVWPTEKDIPLGWKPVNQKGTKQDCLDYIEKVWKDILPASLKNKKVGNY